MEISRRTDYGVRVIMDLAGLPQNGRASTQDIADRQNIPKRFLEQILNDLKSAGMVKSKQYTSLRKLR